MESAFDLGQLRGEVGVPLLPARLRGAQPTPCFQGHDPGVCVVWNRQGVGRAGAGGEHAFTRAHSAVRGRVLVVSGAVRTHHSSGVCRLLTLRLALCHLGAAGPRGRPSQMLGNLGVCVICDSWLLRGVPAARNNRLAFLCASKSL